MPTYMANPQVKINVGGTPYTFQNRKGINIRVMRVENAFDVGSVLFSDPASIDRSKITKDSVIAIYVKDACESSWYTLLSGRIRFVTEGLGKDGESILAKCDGAGYGFAETLVGEEYGSQSENPTLDTLNEIITDATHGIGPKFVEKILGSAVDSGYDYDFTKVDTIAGTVPYLYFPFKPCSKALCDLIDLVQAIKGANAGPHWIVTTDNKLLVSTVGAHSNDAKGEGWTDYICEQAAANSKSTLQQGRDFLDFQFETLSDLANYILYHSNWIYPAIGDLCENVPIGDWRSYATDFDLAYSAVTPKVGANCLTATWNASPVLGTLGYNYDQDLHLKISNAGGRYSIPKFCFWAKRNATFTLGSSPDWLGIKFYSPVVGTLQYFWAYVDLTKLLPSEDTWAYCEFPVGPYWMLPEISGAFGGLLQTASATWDDILNFTFECNIRPQNSVFSLDGVHFEGFVTRAAFDSTLIASKKVKMRIVNDPFAKDDTLYATDDSGTVALMAKAELLRSRTTPIVGGFKTALIRNAWPGQLAHVHARPNSATAYQVDKNFRVTQVTHELTARGHQSAFAVTDDVINAITRAALDSLVEVQKAQRPEFQDRQSTGTKLRDIDITAAILEKDYPS